MNGWLLKPHWGLAGFHRASGQEADVLWKQSAAQYLLPCSSEADALVRPPPYGLLQQECSVYKTESRLHVHYSHSKIQRETPGVCCCGLQKKKENQPVTISLPDPNSWIQQSATSLSNQPRVNAVAVCVCTYKFACPLPNPCRLFVSRWLGYSFQAR